MAKDRHRKIVSTKGRIRTRVLVLINQGIAEYFMAQRGVQTEA